MSYTNALGISWAGIKANMPNMPTGTLHYVESEDQYFVYFADAMFELATTLNRTPANDLEQLDLEDFEANHKAAANTVQPTREVVTQFEKNDKRLKLAMGMARFAEGSDTCIIQIRVPAGGRWIAGGWAVTDVFAFGDALTKVQVVDDQNLLGAGENFVAAMYQDQDVPEVNQGWYFWPEPGGRGGCEIEPIGGYGFLPEGMLFEMHSRKVPTSPATGVLVNLWWAKNE